MSADMQRRIDEVAEAVSGARRTLAAGDIPDMTALERLSAAAVADSARVADADAARLKPRLLAVLADLNELADEMRAAHAALKAKLGGTGTRQRAVAAYGRPADS